MDHALLNLYTTAKRIIFGLFLLAGVSATAQVSITCPGDIDVLNSLNQCGTIVNFVPPVGAGSGTNITTTQTAGLPSGSFFPVGANLLEYTVTNNEGDSDNCSFIINVDDNEDPVFDCPPDIIVDAPIGLCEAVVFFNDPTATDNCLVTSISQIGGLPSGSNFPIGETNIDYQAEDDAGNLAFCRFRIIVNDITDPTITCPADIVLTVFSACDTVVNYVAPVGSDICTISNTVQTNGLGPGASFPVGTTVETYTVTDLDGNTASCSFNVIVSDGAPPEITCPADVSVITNPGECEAVVNFAPATALDNCGLAGIGQTEGLPSGSTFPVGLSTIEYTAFDDAGNSAICNFTVEVIENEDPEIICPANISVENDFGECAAIVGYVAPSGTDNCGGSTTELTSGLGPGSAFPVGTTTETYTVTDISGNQATCSFDITVTDSEDPTIACPADIVTSVDLGNCSAVVNFATPTGDDNCAGVIVTQTGGEISGSAFNIGFTQIEFTAEDAAGNTTSCTFTVTVIEDEAPTITCPGDQNIVIPGGLCSTIVMYPDPIISDNCPDVSFVLISGPASGESVGPGNHVVEYQAEDHHGNTANCTFTISVSETSDPEITCPGDMMVVNDAGFCEAVVNLTVPTATDDCSDVTVTQTGGPITGSSFPVGSTLVEFTAEDEYGNTDICTYNVIVEDQEDPTITCPADILASNDAGNCTAVVNFIAPGGDDNCPGVFVVQTGGPVSGSSFPIGITEIEYTAEDAAGNTATCTFNIEVIDDEDPTITCPADQNFAIPGGFCAGAIAYPDPIIGDNCPGASFTVISGPANGDIVATGMYVVELQAVDAAGNTTNCSFNLTVTETSDPEITCPSDIVVANDAGECQAVVVFSAPSATDSCSTVTVSQTGGPVSGSVFPLGSTAVEFTAEDEFGNTANCTFNIIVEDQEDPTIACPTDITVSTDAGLCEAVANFADPVPEDNCPGVTISQTDGPVSGSIFPIGSTQIEYTAEDAAGNTFVCTFNIIVEDNENPEITCPADFSIAIPNGDCSGQITYADPVISDNCPGATFSVISGPTSGDVVSAGVHIVELQAADAAGNTASCTFELTVTESSNPVFDCPDDLEVPADPGSCEAVVNFSPPTATDSCSTVTVSQTGGPASGTVFPAGDTVLEFTAEDEFGNTATCAYTITVVDDTDPEITCPEDITIDAEPGICGATVIYPVPTGDDNCGVLSVLLTAGIGSGNEFPVGTTTETYEVTDISGNTATCSFEITVEDNENPTITCPADVNMVIADGDCDAIVNYAAPVAADNCPGVTITLVDGFASGETFPAGVTTVTFEAEDASGNTETCSFVVTITENVAPEISCRVDILVSNDLNECGAIVDYTAPIGTDNCGDATTTLTGGLGSGALFPVGTTVETYTVTDPSGNTVSCSFNITVVDDENPFIECPADYTISVEPGTCEATLIFLDPIVGDNCLGVTVSQTGGPASGAVFPVGISIVEFTAEDAVGNTSVCSFMVDVVDDIFPEITCPADIFIDAASGDCDAIVNYADPVATDNCPGFIVTMTSGIESGELFPVGATTVEYQVMDNGGNSASCSFVVTVSEDVPPTIDCPADIVSDNDQDICGAIIFYPVPVGVDNCGGASTALIAGLAPGGEFPVGTTVVTYQVTDISGNQEQCSFNVVVNDTEAPFFNCPADQTIGADENCGLTYVFDLPLAADNCTTGLVVTQTVGPVSGTVLPLGDTAFEFTTVDEAGNDATCGYTITVVDDEAPVFTNCPSDTEIFIEDDACDALATFTEPTATDNCEVTIVQVSGPANNTVLTPGEYDYSFTATDNAGNVTACDFTITITDSIAPVINCPVAFETCEIAPIFDMATATDNCAIDQIVQIEGPESGTTFPIGENTITFEASDVNGNSSTCSFIITILENAPRADAGSDLNICDETSTTLNGNDPMNAVGTWTLISGSGDIDSPNSQSSDVSNLGNGENAFVWTLDPQNGCDISQDTIIVTVEPDVIIDAGNDVLLEVNGTTVLFPTTSPTGGDFLWSPEEGLNCFDCESPVASPDETTLYYLTYTTPLGCIISDSLYVRVFKEFPNTITPDGDGVNDVWNIPGIENFPDVHVVIYNRWGNQVFESVGYRDPWNGQKGGDDLPTASYFYVIDYKVSGKEVLNGTVNIIR